MADIDSDDDDFCFELEVDDEITFKAPPRKVIETSRSSFIMPTFSIKKWKRTIDEENDKENIPSKVSPNIMEHSSPFSGEKVLKRLKIAEALDNNLTPNEPTLSVILEKSEVDCEEEMVIKVDIDEVHEVSMNRCRYHDVCIHFYTHAQISYSYVFVNDILNITIS
jgi:hypothetical protein